MSNDVNAFTQTLLKECDVISQFVTQLELEQASLRRGANDDLLGHAEIMERLAVDLAQLAEQRRTRLATLGFSTDRKGVEAWCAEHPDELQAASTWSAILAQAKAARELQRVNGKLIEIHLQYTATALEALQGGRQPLDLYGPDGQSKSASNQHINHTA
jgi:flagella synthesis protein FlgN